MNVFLTALRACAEPTRLRILALAGQGTFCVSELVDILGQSQPRLSRHLRLMCDAGVLERTQEGANAWFGLPTEARMSTGTARLILERLPSDDPILEADRRQAARVLAERARTATESFARSGAAWDEMSELGLPTADVESAVVALLPSTPGRLIDIGTGTGRMLEYLAPRISTGLGIDASRQMLALARARLARPDLGHCGVRLADMYRLPLPDGAFDAAIMHMVLHHAEDPGAAVKEAARVLRPSGRLVVVDLAPHTDIVCIKRLAHRWPGFTDQTVRTWLCAAGLTNQPQCGIPGPLEVRIWVGDVPGPAAAEIDALEATTP